MDIHLLPHQNEFIQSHAKVCALISGVGAGKSFAGRIWIVKRAISNPETLGFIGANTYSQLRDTVLTPLFAELDTLGLPYQFNAQTGELTIASAKIKCAALENFNMLRGIEIGWAYLDEIRDLREEAFDMMLGRLRDKRSHALQLRATTTPNGFDWIYDRFAGDKKTDEFQIVKAKSTDNPHLPEGYLDTLMANYDERFAQQELDGAFVSLTSGKIYHSFDREVHVAEQTLNPANPSLWVGMDFNVDPMTAVIAEVDTHGIRVIDEIHRSNSNTFEVARIIRERYPNHILTAIPDATGKARKTSAVSSDHAILQQAGFHVKVGRTNPLREDRFNTVNKLLADGRILIDPSCVKLIKNLEQEVHGKNPADIGHINDALGYLCYYYQPLRPVKPRSQVVRFN